MTPGWPGHIRHTFNVKWLSSSPVLRRAAQAVHGALAHVCVAVGAALQQQRQHLRAEWEDKGSTAW